MERPSDVVVEQSWLLSTCNVLVELTTYYKQEQHATSGTDQASILALIHILNDVQQMACDARIQIATKTPQ